MKFEVDLLARTKTHRVALGEPNCVPLRSLRVTPATTASLHRSRCSNATGPTLKVDVVSRVILLKMSVRVVARIRPLLKSENEIDTIVRATGSETADSKSRPTVVKVPNSKNFSEEYSFQFNSVYDEASTQQEIFDAEGKLEWCD